MEALTEEESTALLIRAGVDLSEPEYVDTGNLLRVIKRIQTQIENVEAVSILWVGDEEYKQVEEIKVGTTKEVGSMLTSLLTVKKIDIFPPEEGARARDTLEGIRQALFLVVPFVQTQIDNYPGEYDKEYIEETEKPLQEAVKVLNAFLANL